jgi:hypothetical protein
MFKAVVGYDTGPIADVLSQEAIDAMKAARNFVPPSAVCRHRRTDVANTAPFGTGDRSRRVKLSIVSEHETCRS